MHINWGLVGQIVTIVIAVAALVVSFITARHSLRYRPHWSRDLDGIEREGQRLYNRTGEDAEDVAVSYVHIGPTSALTRVNLVAADKYIEYRSPDVLEGYIIIEWVRSSTQRLYRQNIVEAERRTLRQRWQQARQAFATAKVKGHRVSERHQG